MLAPNYREGSFVTRGQYHIVIRGLLSDGFADGFEGMVQAVQGGNTVLEGPLIDQSQLHGLLDRLHRLGIEIKSF